MMTYLEKEFGKSYVEEVKNLTEKGHWPNVIKHDAITYFEGLFILFYLILFYIILFYFGKSYVEEVKNLTEKGHWPNVIKHDAITYFEGLFYFILFYFILYYFILFWEKLCGRSEKFD